MKGKTCIRKRVSPPARAVIVLCLLLFALCLTSCWTAENIAEDSQGQNKNTKSVQTGSAHNSSKNHETSGQSRFGFSGTVFSDLPAIIIFIFIIVVTVVVSIALLASMAKHARGRQ